MVFIKLLFSLCHSKEKEINKESAALPIKLQNDFIMFRTVWSVTEWNWRHN